MKSFDISKRLIVEAWEKVQANGGAPGVDAVSISLFRDDEINNLYKLWNRMSAGSYMPGPVRAVEIPKDHGAGVRVLGVPNVADRIAQTAVAALLEEKLEPVFHPDSYGYRPGRSAHDALAVARRRCWKQDWVLDLDIRAFFDSVPHDLLLKAVAHHTSLRWVLLYIERWLKAPMQMPDGTLAAREKGTPQGSPISPLLANLFMHYAFDMWIGREYPGCTFERYADDIVAHCGSEAQALALRDSIARRLGALGLELHPGKTKVVFVNMNAGRGCDGGPGDCGSLRGDGGCMALRRRPAGGVAKPPAGALAEDRGAERCGKSRDGIPAGVDRGDGRWPRAGLCRQKRRKVFSWHQNQGLHDALG